MADSLIGEDKRERAHDVVYRAAGISKGTFYKILRGDGGKVQQTKITALAEVLKKPAPMVDRILRMPEDPYYVNPATPAKVRGGPSPAGRAAHEKTRVSKRGGDEKERRKLG